MTPSTTRRTLLQGGAALAGLSVLRLTGPTRAFAYQDGPDGEVIPWLDQPEANPVPEVIVRQLEWERLVSWLTPPDQFFVIMHHGQPDMSEEDWRLEISGLVSEPTTLSLADLQARARWRPTAGSSRRRTTRS